MVPRLSLLRHAAVSAAVLLLPASAALGQPQLADYLPAEVIYDGSIPKPSSVLGFEVGEWHVRHDQLVAYLHRLAESSDRMLIEETGRTHEGRQQLLLTVSSPANLARLDEIRSTHLENLDPAAEAPDVTAMPVVVNLGYSIHGNEASGANAALLAAYHLAAANGEAIEELLAHSVILIDPSLNPDGLSRFAGWANMHRGRVPVADPKHREHNEAWPNGRTNHYWFDLNRDWLLAQHPETHARLAQFHRWRPNVLTDFHEMGARNTYFFQPGVPNRKNPLTPQRNVTLTAEFARYHAAALDEIGSLYYTEETFDDFYYGKGSTYPDVHGAVGILFEQASARGHVQETPNGLLTFPFAIRNQLRTTLSTLAAAHDQREELLRYQREFYTTALRRGSADRVGGYVFADGGDRGRTHRFLELLSRHRIVVRPLAEELEIDGELFRPGRAYLVPTEQPQYLLARSLFEKRVEFEDSTFYDVSTWNLPLAFNLPYAEVPRAALREGLLAEPSELGEPPTATPPAPDAYAYAFDWDEYYAPRALNRFLQAGVKARVATRPFLAPVSPAGGEPRHFDLGTIVIPMGIQDLAPAAVLELAAEAARRDGVEIHALSSGLTPTGIDLGSPSLKPLTTPRPVLVVGKDVATYPAGEIWHLLDRRHEVALPMIELAELDDADLSPYTHVILVDGRYRDVSSELGAKLWRWVRGGGVLVATQRATSWVSRWVNRDGADAAAAPPSGPSPAGEAGSLPVERQPYAQYESQRAAKLISGAIFQVDLDVTHPIAYGYRRPELAVFRNHEVFLEAEKDPFVTVAAYSREPLLSGYVSQQNLAKLRQTPAVTARREGRGAIVHFLDDPTFRAYWYGTDKLFLNALFFGGILEDTAKSPRDRREDH